MCRKKSYNKQLSFSEELNNFAARLTDLPKIDSTIHSLSGWKQLQYSTIDEIYSYMGKLSTKFKDIYNSSGPFKELIDEFNLLRKEVIAIIESEKTYTSDYISSDNISSIRLFFNKISSFISSSISRINESRNIYSEINESPKEINDNIFIVHAAEQNLISDVKKFFLKTKYNIVILEEQASEGAQYVFEKFLEAARPCGFSIVILCSENPDNPLFRPNVLLELGYFLGTVGKKNTLIISNCGEDQMPSDIKGVYIHKLSNRNWKKEVKQSLLKRGFELWKH